LEISALSGWRIALQCGLDLPVLIGSQFKPIAVRVEEVKRTKIDDGLQCRYRDTFEPISFGELQIIQLIHEID